MEKIRRHIYISGRVQGVGFRASLRHKAQIYNVNGWAKNLPDGRVEAVVTGDRNDVEQIIEFAGKGPTMARVNDIQIEEENYRNEFNDFSIKY